MEKYVEHDFKKWLSYTPDWNQTAYIINTKNSVKQDINSLFLNSYHYLESKLDDYYKATGKIPETELNQMIFEFRKYFPKSGRKKGVSYYDTLIKNYLKSVKKSGSGNHPKASPGTSSEPEQSTSSRHTNLTLNQIGLICFYEGRSVTKANCNEIAREYGLKSGHKLYQHYNRHQSKADRQARPDPYSKTIMKNKLNLFNSVLGELSEENKDKARQDIKILENHYKTDYSNRE